MVHGFFSCAAAWEPLQRELAGDVATIAPDLLGYGSLRRHRCRQYTLDDVVGNLLPVVEREQPTHLLGHSMGGIVALALAKELPGRFERVGIIGLPVYRSRREGLAYLHRRSWIYRPLLASCTVAHAGCVALHALRRAWLPFADSLAPGKPPPVITGAFDHNRAGHEGINTIVFAGHAERLAPAVRDPVVVLHGGRDTAAPPDAAAELARRHGWTLDIMPRHGHQAVVGRPGEVAHWVRERLLAPGRA